LSVTTRAVIKVPEAGGIYVQPHVPYASRIGDEATHEGLEFVGRGCHGRLDLNAQTSREYWKRGLGDQRRDG